MKTSSMQTNCTKHPPNSWEDWVNPNITFWSPTVKNCPYMKNSHFAAIRLKDAIVDRITLEVRR